MVVSPVKTELLTRARAHLASVPGLDVLDNEPLSGHTRFAIGGPADVLVTADRVESFAQALTISQESGLPWVVIAGGSNLVVSDAGFRGVVLKFEGSSWQVDPTASGAAVTVEAGAVLQDVVDFSTGRGLRGLETMTGIPGWVGAAVYGNAGAYGHSISERVHSVTFLNGDGTRIFDNAACEFHYRESIFKKRKDWIILNCVLRLDNADAPELQRTATDIRRIRDEKYPPTMKCAGSIFKNFLLAELPAAVQAELPANVIREGKVPSAWFLEQVGAKGMRVGDIQVAIYHANLIYNDGCGTARDLVAVIRQLKRSVGDRFGIPLEEEVQYIGEFAE
jgi:UDP-N-acetylmuramate dehydrogenase